MEPRLLEDWSCWCPPSWSGIHICRNNSLTISLILSCPCPTILDLDMLLVICILASRNCTKEEHIYTIIWSGWKSLNLVMLKKRLNPSLLDIVKSSRDDNRWSLICYRVGMYSYILDVDFLCWFIIWIYWDSFKGFQCVHAINHSSKDCIFTIQMSILINTIHQTANLRVLGIRDKELGSICIRASISHWNDSPRRML